RRSTSPPGVTDPGIDNARTNLMNSIPNRVVGVSRHRRLALRGLFPVVISCLATVGRVSHATAAEPEPTSPATGSFHFPTIRPDHRHARELLANALRYIAPETRMFDPASGYPFEGWNQDPARGLHMRSFTQLTAIGHGLEVLANVAAGNVETPH